MTGKERAGQNRTRRTYHVCVVLLGDAERRAERLLQRRAALQRRRRVHAVQMRRAVTVVHRVGGSALVRTAVQTGEARHLETEAAQLRRDVTWHGRSGSESGGESAPDHQSSPGRSNS
jgi:hypothetical protein